VFAGAAREAVFSNPDVVQRVNAEFIPVALKAALVNRPPDDDEGLLYREIERSKPAPQGICVVNSAGKVLDWTLMFEDNKGMLAFFDHAKERYAQFPDATKPVTAEVYEKFPGRKRKDVEDSGKVLPALDRHPAGKHCPAGPLLRPGTVEVRLFGRALDQDGRPVTDTVRQENYVEDRFNIAVETQEKLAAVLAGAGAGKGPVKLPLEVTRPWVKQAYMGVLDVQPLDNPGHGNGDLKQCEFWAQQVEDAKRLRFWRVEGTSEVFIDRMANSGPGDMHEVTLQWHGYIEMDGKRMSRLLLSAGGKETLKFNSARAKDENELAILPGGHRIDMACAVRFGMLGEPAGPDRVAADAPDPSQAAPQLGVPEEARRQVAETLGPPFLVFRARVQEELKLSEEQKQKLEKRLQDTVLETMRFFEKLGDRKAEEREQELHAYVQKAQENLTAFLQGLLQEEQLKRLRQVMLQREGLLALGDPEVRKELAITDKQRQQFFEVVQDMQKKIGPLLREAQLGGKPEEIQPRVMKIRAEHEGRIEALLNEAQKKQWKEILGKPLDLGE
jgi:hypothetical protein